MAKLEEARWQMVKSMLEEFPELAERATKYLQAREKEGKGCSEPKGLKKVIITISLIEGSSEVADEVIEGEILEELSKGLPKIPWLQRVEKVTVTESHCHERNKKIRKMLKDREYSDKAIKAILEWYQ